METIITVLAPLLAVIVFGRSQRHFALMEKVGGKTAFVMRHPPFKGKGSLPWRTLPLSALVLIGYAIRLIAWLQAHPLLVVLALVMGALVTVMWRKRTWIMEVAIDALMVRDATGEMWRNRTLPDHMNND